MSTTIKIAIAIVVVIMIGATIWVFVRSPRVQAPESQLEEMYSPETGFRGPTAPPEDSFKGPTEPPPAL